MAVLTPQAVGIPSILPTFAAASAGGDSFVQANDQVLVVKNGGGSPINVTIVVPGNDDFGTARPDVVVAVANATERYIPTSHLLYNDGTGNVSVTYSAVTSVTVGLFNI